MKLTTFFVSRTKQIYTKALAVSESLFKIKAMSPWALFETLVGSYLQTKIFAWKWDVQYLQK